MATGTGRAFGPDPDDPAAGLASERTALAWDRSGLAMAVCAVVLVRRVWPLDSPGRLLAAASVSVGIAIWATVLILVGRGGPAPARPGPGFRRLLAVTLAFAVAGFGVSLFPPA